jgi:hypothetical protein
MLVVRGHIFVVAVGLRERGAYTYDSDYYNRQRSIRTRPLRMCPPLSRQPLTSGWEGGPRDGGYGTMTLSARRPCPAAQEVFVRPHSFLFFHARRGVRAASSRTPNPQNHSVRLREVNYKKEEGASKAPLLTRHIAASRPPRKEAQPACLWKARKLARSTACSPCCSHSPCRDVSRPPLVAKAIPSAKFVRRTTTKKHDQRFPQYTPPSDRS